MAGKDKKMRLIGIVLSVILSVSLLSTSILASNYSDIPDNKWYAEPIAFCVDKGIVSGNNDGTFGPNKQITRAEFCEKLIKLANECEITIQATDNQDYAQYIAQYTDLDSNQEYLDAVITCLKNGYIEGTSETKLRPEQYILRQEVATMIDAMFGWTFEPVTHQGGLCNEEISKAGDTRYWIIPMYRFIDLEIYQGNAHWKWDNGSAYRNDTPITKAEMCTVFYYILNNRNWLYDRENTYEKIDLDGLYTFVNKDDWQAYERWKEEEDMIHSDDWYGKHMELSEPVQIDSMNIDVMNLGRYK